MNDGEGKRRKDHQMVCFAPLNVEDRPGGSKREEERSRSLVAVGVVGVVVQPT